MGNALFILNFFLTHFRILYNVVREKIYGSLFSVSHKKKRAKRVIKMATSELPLKSRTKSQKSQKNTIANKSVVRLLRTTRFFKNNKPLQKIQW
jgi:hypothetical protein